MRRGSLTIENLQRFLPQGLSKRLTQSRDVLDGSSGDVTDADDVIHAGFMTNSSWTSVQSAIMSLFNRESISVLERTLLCQNMRSLCKTEIGPFIFEYYKTRLLVRGLNVLLENIKRERSTVDALVQSWNEFFRETLPFLQTVFLPVPIEVTDRNFREATLLGYRDHVVLQLPMENMVTLLKQKQEENLNALRQMCLILQHVALQDDSYNERSIQMERITARIVSPYLGALGLYRGGPEPVIHAARRKPGHRMAIRYEERSGYIGPTKTQEENGNYLTAHRSGPASLASSLTCLHPSKTQTYDPQRRRHSVQFDISVT